MGLGYYGLDLNHSFVVLDFCDGDGDVYDVCEVCLSRELLQGRGHHVQLVVKACLYADVAHLMVNDDGDDACVYEDESLPTAYHEAEAMGLMPQAYPPQISPLDQDLYRGRRQVTTPELEASSLAQARALAFKFWLVYVQASQTHRSLHAPRNTFQEVFGQVEDEPSVSLAF